MSRAIAWTPPAAVLLDDQRVHTDPHFRAVFCDGGIWK